MTYIATVESERYTHTHTTLYSVYPLLHRLRRRQCLSSINNHLARSFTRIEPIAMNISQLPPLLMIAVQLT